VRVRKTFGDVVAVDDIDLEIGDGEFFSLLGPSGSGKTTVLRMIAGFDLPTAGAVLLQGKDVTNLAPYDRDVNTVFQDYALFPHMSVQTNVEYGLRVKGVSRSDRRKRAAEMLDAVRLGDFGSRRPHEMSGGQRQRVALARALVNHPKVLLLDEPLGALDLKLRRQLQVELKRIQVEVGITFVYVTHDQEEALTMSDVIVVMRDGLIHQAGDPTTLYERPRNRFVADFIGTSNFMDGTVIERIGDARVVVRTGRGMTLRGALTDPESHPAEGDSVVVATRPERLEVTPAEEAGPVGEGMTQIRGRVQQGTYLGDQTEYRVETEEAGEVIVRHQNAAGAGGAPGVGPGDPVVVRWLEEANLILAG
jgi:putative spermidine/putrescine transport system ATP-binding protein